MDVCGAGVGTGGTITGIGVYLKSRKPGVQVIAVEPADSPVLSGGQPGAHGLQGIGAGFVPSILNTQVYDEVIGVTVEDAYAMGRLLARREVIPTRIPSLRASSSAAGKAAGKQGKDHCGAASRFRRQISFHADVFTGVRRNSSGSGGFYENFHKGQICGAGHAGPCAE